LRACAAAPLTGFIGSISKMISCELSADIGASSCMTSPPALRISRAEPCDETRDKAASKATLDATIGGFENDIDGSRTHKTLRSELVGLC
jgi:hypothetical protein